MHSSVVRDNVVRLARRVRKGAPPVLVVNPNLCFDRTLWVDAFEAGTVSRPHRVAVTAGGKGVNVVRTLRDLGTPPGWSGCCRPPTAPSWCAGWTARG